MKATKEEHFYSTLDKVFLGKLQNIEGRGATVRLMRLKSNYYRKWRSRFINLVEEVLREFSLDDSFKEELFDRLYGFLKKYFTESGSVLFASTPFHNQVYEKVYTDERDLMLFYKTRDCYYIKTEKVFHSMDFEYRGCRVIFDASEVEGKRGNEKRQVIFELKGVRKEPPGVEFRVLYREGNTETKKEDIRRALKFAGIDWTEEDLEEVFESYRTQTEMDFFLHKRAREFLREQFDLWLYNYSRQEKPFSPERINQLNAVRKVAYFLIDLIAGFEEELVRIWLKPRFVFNSNYVISLYRIAEKGGWHIIEKLQRHSGWQEQVREWIDLGILEKEPDRLIEEDLAGKRLKREYQFLPVDTRYFKDLEPEILALFEDPDSELDGWLIKSENFQALNTLLPKFRGRVKAIYIDPPYNTGSDDFLYADRFRHSTWLTMMENRLRIAREFLREDGVIFVSIGDTLRAKYRTTSVAYLQTLMNDIFGEENFVASFVRKSGVSPRHDVRYISNSHDYVLCYARNIEGLRVRLRRADSTTFKYEDEHLAQRGRFRLNQLDRGTKKYSESLDYPIVVEKGTLIEIFDGRHFHRLPAPEDIVVYPGGNPDDRRWIFTWSREKVKWGMEKGFIVFRKINGQWKVYHKEYELVDNRGNPALREIPYDTLLLDYPNEKGTLEMKNLFGARAFEYPKPSGLITHLLRMIAEEGDIILDFFAGSGTTLQSILNHAKETGHRLKFILVEMADYFERIILPRLKKLAFSLLWKNGRPLSSEGYGIFTKYYTLEQFEDILEKVIIQDYSCEDEDIFTGDLKLAYAVDMENDNLTARVEKIYGGVDITETLSNFYGMKKEKFNLAEDIRPFIWWE